MAMAPSEADREADPQPETLGCGEDDLSEDSEAAVALDPAVSELAGRVATMDRCNPNILRATRASNVLGGCGMALRWIDQDLHHLSVRVKWIQDFWSHSWHGRRHLKMLLLLLLYNGPAAMIAATLAAVLLGCLHVLGYTPGFERPMRGALDAGAMAVFGPWCTMTSGAVFILLLFAWKNGRMVFFDQICIHQFDQRLKLEALVSLGAFLKHSRNFLLVWDATYAGRLWCMLELAAFLSSHTDSDEKIRIRPTAMPPCILGVAFSLWLLMMQWILFSNAQMLVDIMILFATRWICLHFVAAYLRAHYRKTEEMLEQLADFRVSTASCNCCSKGHERDDGTRIICDREVISECIRIWYGSVESFEAMIRTRIRRVLYRQLGGLLFPYHWQLVGSAPLLWGFMDLVAARARVGKWRTAGFMLFAGLTWWLFLFPFVFQATLLLANRFRHQPSRSWQDHLKSNAVALLLTLLSFVGNWTSALVTDVLSALLWFGASALLFFSSLAALRYQARQADMKLNMKEDMYKTVTPASPSHHALA